jgi:hypothetical protein
MPKAMVVVRDNEEFQGKLYLGVDITITDNAGTIIHKPQFNGGQIPRQSIAFDGVAANIVNAIEAKAIAVGGGLGQTLVAADIVTIGIIQGA